MNRKSRLRKYMRGKRIPWSTGYEDFKWLKIQEAISDEKILEQFRNKNLPDGFGVGIDERIVEYPFLFSLLQDRKCKILDAGSTFNFAPILIHPRMKSRDVTIFTAFPEATNFINKKISYAFGDLRELPFRNDWFDEIACISTLEHIGMDNEIYGYEEQSLSNPNQDYLNAVREMLRVLKPGGQFIITVPFGKKLNYGYFQQFSAQMIKEILDIFEKSGNVQLTYFRYSASGWKFSNETDCNEAEAFNPHTGQGKGNDGAAHSRAVCAIHFTRRS
jgi:SAM-dependent methyltransferase